MRSLRPFHLKTNVAYPLQSVTHPGVNQRQQRHQRSKPTCYKQSTVAPHPTPTLRFPLLCCAPAYSASEKQSLRQSRVVHVREAREEQLQARRQPTARVCEINTSGKNLVRLKDAWPIGHNVNMLCLELHRLCDEATAAAVAQFLALHSRFAPTAARLLMAHEWLTMSALILSMAHLPIPYATLTAYKTHPGLLLLTTRPRPPFCIIGTASMVA